MHSLSLENHKQKLMFDHRTLDKKITNLFRKHASDIEITNLKKEKLVLKQEIDELEQQLNNLKSEEI